MQELMLRPTIYRFQTCQEFVDQYHIGGGTIIDIAKILALDSILPIEDLYDGKLPIKRTKKLVLVPTTCGTGSEVTNIAILALTRRHTKKGLANDCMYADSAVLVPELLKGLPFKFFATSSIDALIHAMESSLSPKGYATPLWLQSHFHDLKWLQRDRCQRPGSPHGLFRGLPSCQQLRRYFFWKCRLRGCSCFKLSVRRYLPCSTR